MSVLVYTESLDGKFGKSAFEALTYGSEIAVSMGKSVIAVAIGEASSTELENLAKYGASKIIHIPSGNQSAFNASTYAEALRLIVEKESAEVIVISSTFNGKSLAPRLSAKLKAGLVSNAISLPDITQGFVVKKAVYSGKGFAYFNITSPVKIITLVINSFHVSENIQAPVMEEFSAVGLSSQTFKVTNTERQKGKISLTEAEIVVSGGRGMKGPENWHLIEEFADILGAATACSKPVSDIGWRPHSEHVGQTGLTIGPDLYFAIGISGAIQHLAGVSSSKVIVAINKDVEAPFFKAADYGIVGDALEVMPKLIAAARKIKSA